MKQEEARQLIRSEYINWKNKQDVINNHSKFNFLNYLQSNRIDLLNFRYSGNDQWSTVNSMLSGL